MIKQNIKIAIAVIFIALGIWAIASAFIKLDYSVKTVISFATEQPIIFVENKVSTYIENKNIDKIKVEYDNHYFDCRITYESQTQDMTSYVIFLPTVIPKTQTMLETNAIISSLNIYEYIFKK